MPAAPQPAATSKDRIAPCMKNNKQRKHQPNHHTTNTRTLTDNRQCCRRWVPSSPTHQLSTLQSASTCHAQVSAGRSFWSSPCGSPLQHLIDKSQQTTNTPASRTSPLPVLSEYTITFLPAIMSANTEIPQAATTPIHTGMAKGIPNKPHRAR